MIFFLSTPIAIGLLVGVLALLTLHENRRFARRHRDQIVPEPVGFPRVGLVIICDSSTHQRRENLNAFLRQDYHNVEVVFVVESSTDPVCGIIRNLMAENRFIRCKLIASGPPQYNSLKAQQLLAGVNALSPAAQVIAFADANQQPRSTWLRWLVARAMESGHGAITGIAWMVPKHQSLVNRLFAAIHNGWAAMFGPGKILPIQNEAWAIRRNIFDAAGIAQAWHSCYDDALVADKALRQLKLKIRYEPQCMSAATFQSSQRELTAQLLAKYKSARIYSPGTWWSMLAVLSVAQIGFWLGIAIFFYSTYVGNAWLAASLALATLCAYTLGLARGVIRNHLGKINIPTWKQYRATRKFDVWAWPIVDASTCALMLASLANNRLVDSQGWRYRLSTGGFTRVLGRCATPEKDHVIVKYEPVPYPSFESEPSPMLKRAA